MAELLSKAQYAAIAADLQLRNQAFIDGEFRDAVSGRTFVTTNPATGRPWGPDFPAITLEDIVAVQHRLLQQLGVRHLRAVVGPSYGGWQALQWALSFPDMVDAVGSLVSGLTHPKGLSAESTRQRFADQPAWNGGWHYGDARMTDMLTELRRQAANVESILENIEQGVVLLDRDFRIVAYNRRLAE